MVHDVAYPAAIVRNDSNMGAPDLGLFAPFIFGNTDVHGAVEENDVSTSGVSYPLQCGRVEGDGFLFTLFCSHGATSRRNRTCPLPSSSSDSGTRRALLLFLSGV